MISQFLFLFWVPNFLPTQRRWRTFFIVYSWTQSTREKKGKIKVFGLLLEYLWSTSWIHEYRVLLLFLFLRPKNISVLRYFPMINSYPTFDTWTTGLFYTFFWKQVVGAFLNINSSKDDKLSKIRKVRYVNLIFWQVAFLTFSAYFFWCNLQVAVSALSISVIWALCTPFFWAWEKR